MDKKVIAISGLPGSGSTTTAKLLAEKLDLKFFSPGQVFKGIARGNLNEKYFSELFLELCGKNGLVIPELNLLDDSRGAMKLWGTELGKNPKLHEVIDELQQELAEQGNIIIDGKLSVIMIKNAKPKIWLKASLEERARRTSDRDSLPEEETLEIIKRRQSSEREEWTKIYGFDYWSQESESDIVIDTTNLSPESVVEQILSSLKS